MTLTVRNSSITGAVTAGRKLSIAEIDANWAHVIDSSNQSFIASGSSVRARTMQDKGRDSVCIYEWLTDAQIADVEAGTLLVDCAAAIRTAISEASAMRCTVIEFPGKGYLLNSKAVDGTTLPNGMRFRATGKRDGLDSANGVVFKYTGSAYCWDTREPDGTAENGNYEWEGFTFQCADNAGGMFSLNFLDVDGNEYALTGGASTFPNYILDVRFKNCKFWGAGGGASQTGHGIRAANVYHINIDSQCYFRGWKRAVYLKGCDNAVVDGRYTLNGRHIMLESSGTSANTALINCRWLGSLAAASDEDMYHLWDSGRDTRLIGTQFEDDANGKAVMYLNGVSGALISPMLATDNLPVFELGPDAADYVMIAPQTRSTLVAPIINTATSAMDSADATGNWQGITIISPSRKMLAAFTASTRVRILDGGVARDTDSLQRIGNEIATANGVSIRRYTITAANYIGQTTGIGLGDISVVADSGSYIGSAIQLQAVSLSGFLTRFSIGRSLQPNDRLRLRYVYKMSGTPGAGTFKARYAKNLSTGTTLTTLTVSSSYTFQDVYVTLTGWTTSDTFDIGAYNAGVTDQTCNIAAIIIDVLDPTDSVSTDNGDAAATLTAGTSARTQIWNTAITADRAVTLSTTGAYNGAKFRIVRTASATGAFNLNVGTGPLKAMGTAGSFCEVEYNGSAWVLTTYGTL